MVGLCGACSLLTEVPDLTSGVEIPPDDATHPSNVGNEPGQDAGADRSLEQDGGEDSDGTMPEPDGSPLPEGGADAPRDVSSDVVPIPDAGPTSCANLAPSPKFCDDFDNEATLLPHWDEVNGSGQVPSLDSVAASSPNSMLSRMPANAGTCLYSTASKQLATSHRASTLGYWFRFGDTSEFVGGAVSDQFFDYFNGSIQKRCHLVFSLNPVTPFIVEQITTVDGSNITNTEVNHFLRGVNLRAGVWYHLVADLDLANNRLTASINGVTILENDPLNMFAASCPGTAQPPGASIGFLCQNGTNFDQKVRFDNVTFDAR